MAKYYIKVYDSKVDERLYFLKYDILMNEYYLDDLHEYNQIQATYTKREIYHLVKKLPWLNFKNLKYIKVE